jgi:hypothetical protein
MIKNVMYLLSCDAACSYECLTNITPAGQSYLLATLPAFAANILTDLAVQICPGPSLLVNQGAYNTDEGESNNHGGRRGLREE